MGGKFVIYKKLPQIHVSSIYQEETIEEDALRKGIALLPEDSTPTIIKMDNFDLQ